MNKHLLPRLDQIGRIRIGDNKGEGADRRRKLEHFRLTVPYQSRPILEFASTLYGGRVEEWQNPMEGRQWELLTTVNSLKVYIVPNQCITSGCERWNAAGLQRRCDGETIQFDVVEALIGTHCQCPAEHAERQTVKLERERLRRKAKTDKGAAESLAALPEICEDKTRISVMLQDLPAIGLWRLDTQGYNGATQAMGQVNLLQVQGITMPVEAVLTMGQAKRKKWNTEKQKYDTLSFLTFYLHPLYTPRQLFTELPAAQERKLLPAGEEPPIVGEMWGNRAPREERIIDARLTHEDAPGATQVLSPAIDELAAQLSRIQELRLQKGVTKERLLEYLSWRMQADITHPRECDAKTISEAIEYLKSLDDPAPEGDADPLQQQEIL